MTLPEWIIRGRGVQLIAAAQRLGIATGKRTVAHCFKCQATREVARGGKLPEHGGSGIGVTANGLGGRCHACGEGTDAIDYVSRALTGRGLGDCDRDGKARVRAWFMDYLGLVDTNAPRGSRGAGKPRSPVPAPVSAPALSPAPAPGVHELAYPRDADMAMLRRACKPVDAVADVRSYLERRGINPAVVADRGLAGAIDDRALLPYFARHDQIGWERSRHALFASTVDPLAVVRSVIARRVIDGNPKTKSLTPMGHRRTGLVMACRTARKMLRHGMHPSAWPDGVELDHPLAMSPSEWWPADEPLRLVIAEGEPDFLSWATEVGEDPFAPAVLGVVNGSWTPDYAARVPHGTIITIATHRGDTHGTGDKYATQILKTFAGRADLAGRITRWRAP